jgi:hypothetical protein
MKYIRLKDSKNKDAIVTKRKSSIPCHVIHDPISKITKLGYLVEVMGMDFDPNIIDKPHNPFKPRHIFNLVVMDSYIEYEEAMLDDQNNLDNEEVKK